jgi:hypothetical protein
LPSLVYEYGLAFAHNELEEDLFYFNHEFLQCVGISIAKHGREILKLARKEKGASLCSLSRLLVAITRTKRCLAKYICTWICSEESLALVVVPRPGYGMRWKRAMLKRNKRLMTATGTVTAKQGRLLLTNGSPRVDNYLSPVVYDLWKEEKMESSNDGYWLTEVEEIKWDTLFPDLKPT